MFIKECGEIHTNDSGRELADHGGALFPIGAYYTDISRNDICWHWHDEFELLFSEIGSVKVFTPDTESVIAAGECIFINSGVLHSLRRYGDCECKIKSFVFHPRFIGDMDSIIWQKYIRRLIGNTYCRHIIFNGTTQNGRQALSFFTKAWESYTDPEYGYELDVRENLSKLICISAKTEPPRDETQSPKAHINQDRIKIMVKYIEEHLAEEITLAQIAGSAAVSKNECIRCFNHTIGCTPIQFLRQIRIQKAALLLETDNHKISVIAFECGFKDMSYFNKTFKKFTGCTPSEFKSAHAKPKSNF